MSVGISIITETDVDIDGHYQNLAAEFDSLAQTLKDDGVDISPFLFCPESEAMKESLEDVIDEDEIAFLNTISKDEYHPISDVLEALKIALELSKGYNDNIFSYGKEALISDMEEMIDAITPHAQSGITIQLLRA